MAIPGFGYRTAGDVLMEASLHLVEPLVFTQTSAPIASIGSQTVPVPSTANMYVGAQIVCDSGPSAEIITISAIGSGTITATFAKTHASGATLRAATFPLQQATDPIFTQIEMLGYLSRAQNEFLERCPVAFSLFYQNATTNQAIQALPPAAIEINHVSLSTIQIPITSLIRSTNVVTATFPSPHGLSKSNTFWVANAPDVTFNGVFVVQSVPTLSTLTYNQYAADASTAGGYAQYFVRLYEVTQEELSMNNRQWRFMPGQPTSYFEDRTGNYAWGLGPIPSVGYPLELLCSVRDTDNLTLLDGFLVPDMFVPYIKYKMLAYAWSKDGVFADSQRAAYCEERFKRGVMTVQRYMDTMMSMAAQGVAV